jgi:peroxiredoxin-like protein
VTKKVFQNTLDWRHGKRAFVKVEGRPDVEISTPPEFNGPEGYWSPEDMFLASINSCIMTTFLYFVDRLGFSFNGYTSSIQGDIDFVGGMFTFTKIVVRPRITVPGEMEKEKAQNALQKAEKYCLISACIKLPITIDAEIVIGEKP